MNRSLSSSPLLALTLSIAAVTSSADAQTLEPLPVIVCTPASASLETEVTRIPRSVFHKDETGEVVYNVNGNEAWRRTEVEVKRGQKIEILATGTIRWAPDGIEKIDVTPDGTRPPYRDGWNYKHFPFPEAGIGSLVMRIGKGVYPVGSESVIEAEDDGFVEFMVNDDVLSDNSGYFFVKLSVLQRSTTVSSR